MQKLRIKVDNLSQKISPGIYGLLSIIFGGMGDLIAYLMYPGYDFRKKAVSSLCLGPGWFFFQAGTVISGFFAILFLIYLEKTCDNDDINKNLKKYAKITAIISCVSFIILGIFCGSNIIIAYIHGINAIISWIFGLLYISFYNLLMIKSSNYSKYIGYFGFITTFTLGLMMVFFILHLFPALRFLMIILPSLEWANTISLIFWYLLVAVYIIYKRI